VTITNISDNVGTIQGSVADGAITNDTTPTLTGTFGGATAGAALVVGETLRISRKGVIAGNATVTVVAAGQSTWTYTPATPLTINGSTVFIAQVIDGAGNGGPLSAPSANRSGRISPTSAADVAVEFADVDDLPILDGGPCEVGLESTVLDLSRARPAVLRPGSVTTDDLSRVLGTPVTIFASHTQGASPGTSASHYAPDTRAELVAERDLAARLAQETSAVAVIAPAGTAVPAPHELFALPRHASAYAQMLYSTLRRADSTRPAAILIVPPTETGGLWDAARDRLMRATARRNSSAAKS
jgi:hypothetical protein